MPYIPKKESTDSKKKMYNAPIQLTGVDRVARANESALAKLKELGLDTAFQAYQGAGNLWEGTKKFGSTASDIILRGGYASGAVATGIEQGTPPLEIAKNVGTELASGIGGLKGEKVLPGKVIVRGIMQSETPFLAAPRAAIALSGIAKMTELAADIGFDLTTYIPGAAFVKGGAAIKGAIRGSVKGTFGKVAPDSYAAIARSFSTTADAVAGGERIPGIIKQYKGERITSLTDNIGELGLKRDNLIAKGADIKEIKAVKSKIKKANNQLAIANAIAIPTKEEGVKLGMQYYNIELLVKYHSQGGYSDKLFKRIAPVLDDVIKMDKGFKSAKVNDGYLKFREEWERFLLAGEDYDMASLMTASKGLAPSERFIIANAGGLPMSELDKVFQHEMHLIGRTENITKLDVLTRKPAYVDAMRRIDNAKAKIVVGKNIDKAQLTIAKASAEIAELQKSVKTQLRPIYFHNNPKLYGNLLEKPSARAGGVGGFKTAKATSTKGKVLQDGVQLLDWWYDKGGTTKNLPQMILRNVAGRIKESENTIRKLWVIDRWTNELPTVFRKLDPNGVKDWSSAVMRGENLFLPSGSLRFFKSEYIAKNAKVAKAIEEGMGLTVDAAELENMLKNGLGVTSHVEAYAVPHEIAVDIGKSAKLMADDKNIIPIWNDFMGFWAHSAILSTGFHTRNNIEAFTKNYMAGINPVAYRHAERALMPTTKNGVDIAGKLKKKWMTELADANIMRGSMVGQIVGKTGMTEVPVLRQAFQASRWVGTQSEKLHRAALYIDGRLNGMSLAEAAIRVKKWQFDYDEATPIIRAVKKNLMPFIQWPTKNIPLLLDTVLTQPVKLRNIEYLRKVLASDSESELNPEYWRNVGIWEMGDKYAASIGISWPGDLNALSQPGGVTGQLGPFGSAINVLNNYDSFLGKEISEFKGQTEGLLLNKYVQVNPKFKYALDNIFPLLGRYANDMPAAFYKWLGDDDDEYHTNRWKALSYIIGIKIIPQIPENQRKQQIYNMMNEIDGFEQYRSQQEELGKPIQPNYTP